MPLPFDDSVPDGLCKRIVNKVPCRKPTASAAHQCCYECSVERKRNYYTGSAGDQIRREHRERIRGS